MPGPLVVPLTMAGVTGATMLAKAIGDKNRKEDLERLNPTPKVETIQQNKNPLMGAIESFGNMGGGMLKAIGGVIPQVKTFVNDVESGVYSDKPKQQEVKVQPTPSPIKSAILETPTPTVQQKPVQVKEEVKPEENVFLGRSDKFKTVSQNYPDNYNNIVDILNQIPSTDLERQLALDIAAQESIFDPKRKANEHGFDGVTINPDTGKPYPWSSAEGLFQFTNGTWSDYLKENPEEAAKGANRSNPLDAYKAFLYTIRHGITGQGLSRWNASNNVWGSSYTPEELSVFKK